jgi:hypothetical protein
MQRTILALIAIALIAALLAPIQPAAAAPSVMPTTTVEALSRPGPSRPGEPQTVTRRCTLKTNLKNPSCSMKIDDLTVYVYYSVGKYPVTFSFSDPDMGAFSQVLNGSLEYRGYTFSNSLQANGNIIAKVQR